MVLNEVLKKAIEKQFRQNSGKEIIIKNIYAVTGGDTSTSYRLECNGDSFFLKCMESHSYPDIFEKELAGLQLLADSKSIAIPKPLFIGKTADTVYLVAEFIAKQPPEDDFWEIFAEKMATLHQQTAPQFGLDTDNYIGTLPQSNKQHTSWTEFYGRERIEPLVRKCIDQQLLDKAISSSCETLCKKLPEIFPVELPALVHGDLWGGNYLAGPGGQPYIFDPAVYYGNREMDLAMTRLFGGFDRRFYWHYEEIYPLAHGWQERISLCQLYPLLVHAVLFGGGYVQRVKNILSAY